MGRDCLIFKSILYFSISIFWSEKEVEVAVEVKEPPPPDVVQLCRETFQKSAEYLHGELEGCLMLRII